MFNKFTFISIFDKSDDYDLESVMMAEAACRILVPTADYTFNANNTTVHEAPFR